MVDANFWPAAWQEAFAEYELHQAWNALQSVPSYVERFSSEVVAVPVVVMEDEIIHTATSPFCGDDDCPCHKDENLFYEYVEYPVNQGLMTTSEAMRLFYAEHL